MKKRTLCIKSYFMTWSKFYSIKKENTQVKDSREKKKIFEYIFMGSFGLWIIHSSTNVMWEWRQEVSIHIILILRSPTPCLDHCMSYPHPVKIGSTPSDHGTSENSWELDPVMYDPKSSLHVGWCAHKVGVMPCELQEKWYDQLCCKYTQVMVR